MKRTILPLFGCLMIAALCLAVWPGPARAEEYRLEAGQVKVVELDSGRSYDFHAEPGVEGMISQGHVAVHAAGFSLEDDLKLGSMYQVVGGHRVAVFDRRRWSMTGVVGASKIVMQVFDGALIFRVE
jgi:hypothetical protein